jgi:hypothetical protein
MNRIVKIGILSLAAAVVLFAGYHRLRAQEKKSANVKAPSEQQHFTTSETSGGPVGHFLIESFFTQGFAVGIPETGGEDLAVDTPTTIKCPSHEGCTLEIEQSVQVGLGSASENLWGSAVQLDGSYLAYSPYVGEVPTDGSYVLATGSQTIPLTYGPHTVQSFVFSYFGLTLEDYHINYRLYIP